MATITLYEYFPKIDELIDERRFEEAIAHCRHILKHYPRHVDTYRAFAKVLLEQGDFNGAVDLLHRVLSADPNDFIAHVGLSMAYQEETETLPQSIWHLERALELKPYNVALQEELAELYARIDTAVPERIAPSQGALARLYLESEMYPAAIDELRLALEKNGDRIDLKVLLAETLWRANQRVEVVALCLEILDMLPNCIQANAILAETWLQTGRTAEAQVYLKRLQALTQMDQIRCTGETAVCHAFRTPGAPPIPQQLTIEFLGERPPIVDEIPSGDWVDEFPLGEDIDYGEEELFDWLAKDPLADTGVTTAESTPQETVEPAVRAESTDWFVDPEEDVSDESLEELLGDVDDSADLADWLQDIDQQEPTFIPASEEVGISEFEDIFTEDDTSSEMDDESLIDGFTDLFGEEGEPDALASDDMLAGGSGTAEIPASDLEEADIHTGFTSLFDELTADPFQADSLQDGETVDVPGKTSAEVKPGADKPTTTGDLPDWLAETTDTEFEPIQIDNRLTSNWLTGPGDEDDDEKTSTPTEIKGPTDDLAALGQAGSGDLDLPDWMVADEQAPIELETLPPLEDDVAFALEEDDLTGDSTIPDWLTEEEPGQEAVDLAAESPLSDSVISLEAEPVERESDWVDDLTALASKELPEWLLGEEGDIPRQATGEFTQQTDEELQLLENDETSQDWLMGDDTISQDEMEESVIGENDKRDLPDEEPKEMKDELTEEVEETVDRLDDLAGPDEEIEEDLLPTEEDDAASFASRIAAGEGGAIDEPPTQISFPEESFDEEPSAEDLAWLDELGAAAIEPPEEQMTLDWTEEEQHIEDVIAGVTGELKADLDWLDTLAEEAGVSEDQEADKEDAFAEQTRIDTGELAWLDELESPADLAESAEEELDFAVDPALELPDLDQTMVQLPEESDVEEIEPVLADEPAVSTVTEEPEAEDQELDSLFAIESDELPSAVVDEFEAALEVPEDLDSAMAWLEQLAAKQGAALEELPSLSDDSQLVSEAENGLADEVDVAEEVMAEAELISDLDETDEESVADLEPETWEEPAAEMLDSTGWLEHLAASPEAEQDEEPVAGEELAEDFTATDEIVEEMGLEEELTAETLPELDEDEELTETFLDDTGWLEHLTASPDAEPEGMPDEIAEFDFEAEPDTALEAASITEEADTVADVPEDLDDAMGWLEELAAEQGAPLEELPSIAKVVDDAPEAALESVAEQEEKAADWASETLAELVEESKTDELTEALDWLEALAREDGVSLDSVEVEPLTASEDELAEALDWLEQMALSEEEPAKIETKAKESDIVDLTDEMPDDPDEALAWLENLAEEKEGEEALAESVVDEPDGLLADMEAALDETAEPDLELAPKVESEIEDDVLAEIPDDPDAAMAWLEQLAAKQGARLEELPTVTAEDLEPEADSSDDSAEDSAGISVVDTAADLASALAEASPEAEEEMGWLDEMADEQIDVPDLAEVLDIEGADEIEVEEFDAATDEVDVEVAEEPDDAMAWLEELAAQQDAVVEEIPTPAEKEEDQLETSDELLAETVADAPEIIDEGDELIADTVVDAGLEVSPEEMAVVGDIAEETAADLAERGEIDDLDADAGEDAAEIEEPVLQEELDEQLAEAISEPVLEETLDSDRGEAEEGEEVEDAMPDWLDFDADEEGVPGKTEWLDSLEEPDVTGWLEEEDDVSASGIRDRSILTMPEPQPDVDTMITGIDLRAELGSVEFPDDELGPSVLDLDAEKLESARQAVTSGNLDDALSSYQELVDAGGGLMTLIADLKTAVVEHEEQPLLRHLLGDAYMRNGQLQKALETYRSALDQL